MANVKRGFSDIRDSAALLTQGRPPKSVSYTLKNPLSSKLKGALKKVTGAAQTATTAISPTQQTFGSRLLRGAALTTVAATAKSLLSAISGKAGAQLGSVQRAKSLGATVVEETNPDNLRRPLVEGPSIDPAAAAKSISETAAKHVLKGLVTGVAVARGVPPKQQLFKTLTKLKASPRYFDAAKAAAQSPDTVTSASPASEPTLTISPTSVLVRQKSLLEDEIMHRLVLLAENVYQPIADYSTANGYGPPTILEAFRIENSGTSPHERGEGLDLTWNVSNAAIYELAAWIRDHIIYDELILCHTNIGSAKSWIHITFKVTGRRRIVYTKTFDDQFIEGLHLYGPYTDDALRAADLAAATTAASTANYFAQMMAARDARLQPVSVSTPEQSSGPTGSTGGLSSGGQCKAHPITGELYVPINDSAGAVMRAVDELLAIPEYLEMAQNPDRTAMVPFAREVVIRARGYGAPSSGPGAVGMNGVRGNSGDPSGDAVAILNPTGAKGGGSWETTERVQIMDIVGSAHGGYGSNPTSAWIDQTNLCDSGGVFLDP